MSPIRWVSTTGALDDWLRRNNVRLRRDQVEALRRMGEDIAASYGDQDAGELFAIELARYGSGATSSAWRHIEARPDLPAGMRWRWAAGVERP